MRILAIGLVGCSSNASQGPSPTGSSAPSAAISSSAIGTPASATPASSSSAHRDQNPGSSAISAPSWAGCFAGFRAESTPRRDLMRLAMLCGPSHGMRAVGPAREERVVPENPLRITLALKREECVRVLAAADAPIEVRLESAGQPDVSSAQGRWAIAPEDRAFCAVDAMSIDVIVKAIAGPAQVAVQPWSLP